MFVVWSLYWVESLDSLILDYSFWFSIVEFWMYVECMLMELVKLCIVGVILFWLSFGEVFGNMSLSYSYL